MQNKFDISFSWFQELRNSICKEFESLEKELQGTNKDTAPGSFYMKPWDYHGEGGGEISLMHGRVFEKVGVNISSVKGTFSTEMRSQIPGTENSPNFRACGISLVTHMHSPLVPSIHMNTRFIETEKEWFGGGIDLTPSRENKEDTLFLHSKLEEMCNKHDKNYYPKFKKECDAYFYLKHRKEQRGVGGIFYDYLDKPDFSTNFLFTQDVGKIFLEIYPKIVRDHMNKQWTKEEKDFQLFRRGRYVEFNLLYDRGTKFGLLTGGNPDAIFISLPPMVSWR